jgi:hypothetical protein
MALTAKCRFLARGQNYRHRLFVDRLDDAVGLGREKSIEIRFDLTLFQFTDAGPSGPDTSKEE